MPIITKDDVINAYIQYTGRPPTQAELNQHMGQSVPNVAQAAFNFFNPGGASGGGGGEGGGIEFPEFGMSEVETHYFELLSSQIEEQIRITKEENARVARRRAELDKQIKAQYGISLEQFEAEEAFRSAKTSRAQGERLDKALAGELPVDPALERQITEDEKTVRGKLLEQVGTGYETSTPGIQSLADFRQRAEELRSAARHDEIDRGIAPAAATAQFGLSLIGNESLPDTASIAQGLQASIGSRQASIQAATGRSNAMLALQELQQRERLAQLEANLRRGQFNAGNTKVVPSGGGVGQATGTAATAVIPSFYQSKSGDPFYT